MVLKLITAPTTEPLTLLEVKTHSRIEGLEDDDYLTGLMVAARQYYEGQLNRAFLTQTWELLLDQFPSTGDAPIELPLAPLQSVASVTYIDTAGATQTWTSADYIVDIVSEPGRIHLAYAKTWPMARYQANAITIRFVAGYATSAAVPEYFKLGLKFLIAHWYENREPVQAGAIAPTALPLHIGAVMDAYRVYTRDSF